MAGYWQNSNSQIHDLNGKPLIGAKAFFYLGGTTTPLSVYRSYDLGTVNLLPNPVVSDGAGFFPSVFIDEAALFYRVRITTASGVTVIDVDGLPVIGPTGGGGGGSSTPVDPDAVMKTGDMVWRYDTGLRSGFVRLNGRTIGSATSGASERANADVQALFEYLWQKDANLAVLGGRGGSSAIDWSANKQLTLPTAQGRALVGLDTMGNTAAGVIAAATTLGWLGGEEKHLLTTTEIPAHSHGVNDPGHAHLTATRGGLSTFQNGPVTAWVGDGTTATQTATTGITIQNAGGGASHNNVQPSLAATLYMKI